MLFELPTNTECELTTFVGRTQKSGPDDVPAVTFRLKLAGVSNTLLDRFSKTIRHTIYKAVEGQENLPGVEDVTPLLQSKDLVHWAPETCLDGWTVYLARGISDGDALQMGGCKIDAFRFDFFEGGRMDVDFRVSTADVDEDGAGMLWGRQKRKVFVTIVAPEMPAEKAPAIDGSKGHPGAAASAQAEKDRKTGDMFDGDDGPEAAKGDAEAVSDHHAGDFGTDHDDDGSPAISDTTAFASEVQRGGENWPFPTGDDAGADAGQADAEKDAADFEAGLRKEIDAAGMKPKARGPAANDAAPKGRRTRRAAGGSME